MYGISQTSTGAIVAEGPEGVALYRLLTIRRGLKLEIETGMKLSRGISTLAILQREGITAKRTKKGALADLEAYLAENYPAPHLV
jgi:hypothetical protein